MERPSSPDYPDPIRVVHRGGAERVAIWHDWYGPDTKAGRAQVRLWLGELAGIVTFSLSHGWGSKPVDDWRIHPEDQTKLLAWAETQGRRIGKTPRSPGRKKIPRRGAKVDPRQTDLFGD